MTLVAWLAVATLVGGSVGALATRSASWALRFFGFAIGASSAVGAFKRLNLML